MGPKQVFELQSSKERIDTNESNEHQRNWSDEHWKHKASDSLSNYDPTRRHLNFEVTKGGVVQPIDTSKTINQKMDDILKARGITCPNDKPGCRQPQRIIAKFIVGGNRERMHQLAFGSQKVDLSKDSDNSHITRNKDIELWAKDAYDFFARHFGEQNIVSFYVHLDETNPHCHCTLLPINNKNRFSWTDIFGKSIRAESENLSRLHDAFYEEVGKKWGLERGLSTAETKAKHRSTEEYKRDLIREVNTLQDTIAGLKKQIRDNERKLKSLSTMLENLNIRKEEIQKEIDSIAAQFGQEGVDTAQLAKRMKSLRSELVNIDSKIAMRQQMLDDTNLVLAKANAKLEEMIREHDHRQQQLGDDIEQQATKVERDILSTYRSMVEESFEAVRPTLSYQQNLILDDSGFNDLTEKPREVIECALFLAMGFVHEATNYAESHGGGGSSTTGWGRQKDEDDEQWWRRCITKSAAMMRPGRKRNRHR